MTPEPEPPAATAAPQHLEREKNSPRWIPLVIGLILAATGAGLSRVSAPGIERTASTLEGADGLRVPALRFRPPEPRGRALLVHGITASKETMVCLAEALAESGLECLSIDLPGHGRSPHGFEQERLRPAVLLAARALQPQGELDVYVGHSLGASLGQRCLISGELRPKVLALLGSPPLRGPGGGLERVLGLTGRFDLLVPPESLRRAAPPGVEVVVSGTADHLLEPFDPTLIEHVRAVGPAPPARRSAAWIARLAGLALLGLACAPLAVAVLPRERSRPGLALAAGAAVGGLALACAACALSPAWVDLYPTVRALPWWLGFASGLSAGSGLGARVVSRVAAPKSVPAATCAHAAFLVGAGAGSAGLALSGVAFVAFILALGCVAAAAATLFAWLVERRSGSLAASACFGVVAAYVPALWAPILL